MKKNKFKNISGVTLVEILIGIAVSALMVTAMFTTYNVVNNSYTQGTPSSLKIVPFSLLQDYNNIIYENDYKPFEVQNYDSYVQNLIF